MAERYVALMRGINVGGNNKLSMRDLAALFEEAGCSRVVTYIQSGNVIFDAKATIVKKLAGVISARIKEKFGLSVPIVLRTRHDLLDAEKGNPFPTPARERVYVMFLRDKPSAGAILQLDPNRSPGDTFKVVGSSIFMLCENAAKTKLTNAYFDSKLSTISTSRNWRTVLKLVEMVNA